MKLLVNKWNCRLTDQQKSLQTWYYHGERLYVTPFTLCHISTTALRSSVGDHVLIKPLWPSSVRYVPSRFWVLWGQRQGQHQCEADLWASGWHHLWKDVREPGCWRSCRHRSQTGAPADRAACSTSPGLCMLKLTTPPRPFCSLFLLLLLQLDPRASVPSSIIRFTYSPASLCNLGKMIDRWAREQGWKMSEILSASSGLELEVCLFLVPPYTGAKMLVLFCFWIRTDVGLMPKRVQLN